ncbi:hypothetical protein BX264_5407 [Streptomyces sp. 2333.5]|uniref:hypothetical protein n=1 Tax=unclassified Streptomyces TaxID=2593676 RepID=UPI0008981BDB|nr:MULTISPECIES: hypothetical protein [unclassified Streptomyces]PJJ04980.1 hypothetical protein BX264_5407 [Streptomyces sp. 2333.5]SEE65275.1 hypothetical protein SAMN05428943_5515 [Streptomyces sp. 2314.4]SEE91815.1 hypothetical protein SAMN05428942_5510 [Streptomyces sp. 2112.2]
MKDTEAWKVIASGNGDGVFLAADFAFTGRPEAGFAELVPLLDTEHAAWETVPPRFESGGSVFAVKGADYLSWWTDDLRKSGRQVKAVLGYCVGSVYAAALAEKIAEWQSERPVVLLFDPERPSKETLYWQFHKAVGNLHSVLPSVKIETAQKAGEQVARASEDLQEIGRELFKIFQSVGSVAFESAGLDDIRSGELLHLVGVFLAYLVAAGDIDFKEAWKSSIACSSSSPRSGLNPLPSKVRSHLVRQELHFDVEHADLLRSGDVARAVSRLLS